MIVISAVRDDHISTCRVVLIIVDRGTTGESMIGPEDEVCWSGPLSFDIGRVGGSDWSCEGCADAEESSDESGVTNHDCDEDER